MDKDKQDLKVGLVQSELTAKYLWDQKKEYYALYAPEIISQFGLPFEKVSDEDLKVLENIRQLPAVILPSVILMHTDVGNTVRDYVRQGGILVGIGPTGLLNERGEPYDSFMMKGLLDDFFGIRRIDYIANDGFLSSSPNKHFINREICPKLKFRGPYYKCENCQDSVPLTLLTDAIGSIEGVGAALRNSGDGFSIYFVPDLLKSMFFLQQSHDPFTNSFDVPVSDLMKRMIVRSIAWGLLQRKRFLVQKHYWPNVSKAVVVFTHDVDGGITDHFSDVLSIEKKHGIRSTFYIQPMYQIARSVLLKAYEGGWEIGAHCVWCSPTGVCQIHDDDHINQEGFIQQKKELERVLGRKILGNRNHILHWKGDVESWLYLERAGFGYDSTKGDFSTGQWRGPGFAWGTCFPYRPLSEHDEQNRIMRIIELPLLVEDAHWYSREKGIYFSPFLDWGLQKCISLFETVYRFNGLAVYLFHPGWIGGPGHAEGTYDELINYVKEKKDVLVLRGEDVVDWWNKRENANIHALQKDSVVHVEALGPSPNGLTIVVSSPTDFKLERVNHENGSVCPHKFLTEDDMDKVAVVLPQIENGESLGLVFEYVEKQR